MTSPVGRQEALQPAVAPAGTGAGDGAVEILAFRRGTHHFGLPVMAVEKVIAAVNVTPLRAAPRILVGLIDFHGAVVPVLDLSRRFGLRGGVPSLQARFVLARFGERPVALVADEVLGVQIVALALGLADPAMTGAAGMPRGVSVTAEGLIYIYDGQALLSPEEARRMAASLQQRPDA